MKCWLLILKLWMYEQLEFPSPNLQNAYIGEGSHTLVYSRLCSLSLPTPLLWDYHTPQEGFHFILSSICLLLWISKLNNLQPNISDLQVPCLFSTFFNCISFRSLSNSQKLVNDRNLSGRSGFFLTQCFSTHLLGDPDWTGSTESEQGKKYFQRITTTMGSSKVHKLLLVYCLHL